MSRYRRARFPGGTYFFTLVTHERHPWFASPSRVVRLRAAFRHVREKYPFSLDAAVVLPDHMHFLMRLPEGDDDYPLRIRLIKHFVTRGLGRQAGVREQRRIWQNRYWEHLIRDETDWCSHVDYVHYNPVRHGLVTQARDWPYSSFSRAVEAGWYSPDWGKAEDDILPDMECE